jgi:glycosidase
MAVKLLLTLPGLPFIYYGEEIGMTGDKPDERLRTPMQWSGSANAGFTKGPPWEALQADWATTNVAAEDNEPGSLLALTRQLIHLRTGNAAIAAGDLFPLVASNDAVAVYLRRVKGNIVLVIANLGMVPLKNVTIMSTNTALPPGHYTTRSLDAGRSARGFSVGSDGRIRNYEPFDILGPMASQVVAITRR